MLHFYDSFDHYDTSRLNRKGWNRQGNANDRSIVAGEGRNGTAGFKISWHTTSVHGRIDYSPDDLTNTSRCIVQFAVKKTCDRDLPIFTITGAGVAQLTLWVGSGGALNFRQGSNPAGAVRATSTISLSDSVWHYLEIEIFVHSSTGTIRLNVDGSVGVNATGVNTVGSFGSNLWDTISIGSAAAINGAGGNTVWYDDVVVMDSTGATFDDFIGDCRVIAGLPDGAGTYSQLTPTAGANYENVNENPPDEETSQVSGSTTGLADTYEFPALGVAGDILAVTTVFYAKADQAGVRELTNRTRIASSNYDAPNPALLGGDWEFARMQMELNPATASGWSVADVDGAEFGPLIAT